MYKQSAETMTRFCRLNQNIKRNIPIRAGEMGLLIFIVKSNTVVTPAMAAEFFHVSKPMIAKMITVLVKQEYIAKKQSDTDKRVFTLLPLDNGIHLVEKTYQEYFKMMKLLEQKMGKNKFNQMIGLLEEANLIMIGEED